MGAIKWMTSLIMILMFSIAIINYVSNFATDNNAYIDISDDTDITGLETSLKAETSTSFTEINGSIVSFGESEISEGDETTRTGGQFKNLYGVSSSVKTIIDRGFKKIFGDSVEFGYILTLFLLIIGSITILVVWKVWKGGNPD